MKITCRLLLCIGILAGSVPAQWTTFGGDAQRTGWSRGETVLNTDTAATLELKWKLHVDNPPKELTSLTAPILVDTVKTVRGIKEFLIVAGSSDRVFAIDADAGKLVWQKTFDVTATSNNRPNGLCPFALNATPAAGPGRPQTIYAISSDGRLHTLSAVTGEDKFPPQPFVPAFSKNWSLNLVGNKLYTAIGQGCNRVPSAVWSMDLGQENHPIQSFQAGRPGIWGRAGVTVSPKSGTIFAETGDGLFDPASNSWAETFLALSPKDLKLADYYTPTNEAWLTRKDLDMGNVTPIVFEFKGKEYLVGGGKEGRLFLLDTSSLGGETHREPLYRSELLTNEDAAYAGHGFWGGFATWENPKGERWIFAPAWGPPHPAAQPFAITNGDAPRGSIMAFRVESKDGGTPVLVPAWISRDMHVPEPPIIANGVVIALSSGEDVRQADDAGNGWGTTQRVSGSTKAVLHALDANTGKELFSSGDTLSSFTHFGGLAVSNGRVFVTTYDGNVFAFGIKNELR